MGSLENLNSFTASLMFGEACDILLIRVICLIMSGKMQSLTEIPERRMKDIQGMWVKAWSLTNAAAVTENTGAKYAQMKGRA